MDKWSYHDKRRKDLEFQEGDHVFLRVTPMTGVGRALKSKKMTPRFIGPYQISERIGTVAYRVGLPPHLSNLHDVFHVSQLRKYVPDPSHHKNFIKSNSTTIHELHEVIRKEKKTITKFPSHYVSEHLRHT